MVGLLAFNSKGSGPYSHGAAGATYRFSFGCIAVFIAWMAYYHTWREKPHKSEIPQKAAAGEDLPLSDKSHKVCLEPKCGRCHACAAWLVYDGFMTTNQVMWAAEIGCNAADILGHLLQRQLCNQLQPRELQNAAEIGCTADTLTHLLQRLICRQVADKFWIDHVGCKITAQVVLHEYWGETYKVLCSVRWLQRRQL